MSGRLEGKVCVINRHRWQHGARSGSAFHAPGRHGGRVRHQRCQRPGCPERGQLPRAEKMVSLQPCDLTKPEQCQAVVDLAIKTFGRIDVLYNNAAKAYFNWIEDVSDEEWARDHQPRSTTSSSISRGRRGLTLKKRRDHRPTRLRRPLGPTFTNLGAIAHSTAKAGIVGMTRTHGHGGPQIRNTRQFGISRRDRIGPNTRSAQEQRMVRLYARPYVARVDLASRRK